MVINPLIKYSSAFVDALIVFKDTNNIQRRRSSFKSGGMGDEFIYIYVCMYVRTYVRMYICMYVRTYICMYICIYLRMCVRVMNIYRTKIKLRAAANQAIYLVVRNYGCINSL